MTYDASNRKDIRAAQKAAERLDEDRLLFLRTSMDTPNGRRFFFHLLATCACFVDIPTFDPHHDYFSAGRRSVGLQLMAEILTHCPDQYILMTGEENARLAAAAERSRSPNPGRDDTGRPEPGPDEPDSPDLFDDVYNHLRDV